MRILLEEITKGIGHYTPVQTILPTHLVVRASSTPGKHTP